LKIVVCVKEVPDTTEVKINPATNTLIRERAASMINPFDLHAVEEALRIKDQVAATAVTVLSMGLARVAETLKELIARGADAAILLSDPAFAGSDTLATSYILAKGIAKLGAVDLILCGQQAVDGDTGQVGPELAERLGIPHLIRVTKLNELNQRGLVVERTSEAGYERVQVTLPALLTVDSEINEPRLPSLQGKRRAKHAPILIWSAEEIEAVSEKIGLNGSPTRVKNIFTPELKSQGTIFSGPPEAAVKALVEALMARKIVGLGR
jgi:electron transfer flavoprotein beta subunit